jgi:preprotein translocase subunit SecA
MFEAMMGGVAQDFVRYAMQVQVNVVAPGAAGQAAPAAPAPTEVAEAPAVEPAAVAPDAAAPTDEAAVPEVLRHEPEPVVQNLSYSAPDEGAAGGGMSAAVRASAVAEGGGTAQPGKAEEPAVNTPVVKSDWDKTPRNAPCPCGSGKKFKMCHGA